VDFLEIMGAARQKAITPINVQKAWQAVGLEPFNLDVVISQLLQKPSIQLVTPPSIVTWTGPTREAVQVATTTANIAQVNSLFQQILKGEKLDPATVFCLQKLQKSASKAIANSTIQRMTNVELIAAEITKKKQANRAKGKNYSFARVLNAETLQEREAFCLFQDHWAHLSRCQPNLLGPATGKATGKVIGKAMRKAISKATAPAKPARQAKPIQTAPVCEQGVEPAADQVIRTRSGRALVKRVIFDAGKN